MSLDVLILGGAEQTQPGSASVLVGTFHALLMDVLAYTVNTPEEWLFLSALGVDGIYTDDIPLGLGLQGSGEN